MSRHTAQDEEVRQNVDDIRGPQLPVDPDTLYRKIVEGTFPAQLRISTDGAGWHESEIDRWIADPVAWRPEGGFREIG